jgi:cardiolipin synthase
MNHFVSSIFLRNVSKSIQSNLINQCLKSQFLPARWITHSATFPIRKSSLKIISIARVSKRNVSNDDKKYERPFVGTRRKSMAERTRVVTDKTKEMSDKTKLRLRETRAVVKDKLEGMRENIFTYPNGLSVMRIVLTPVMGYCILEHHHMTALSIFLVAGISDLLDGYIARTFSGQKSVLGSVLDPLADKFLVATSFLTLTMDDLIPVPLTVLIISRDLVLVGWGVYIRYLSLTYPKTITKFFDFSMPTAEVKATFISKVNTVLQLSLICSTVASPVFSGLIPQEFLVCLWYTTGVTTLFSGLGYLSMRGSYRVIKSKNKSSKT